MIEKSLIKKAQHETWQTDDYILEQFKNYQKGGGTMDLDEFKKNQPDMSFRINEPVKKE